DALWPACRGRIRAADGLPRQFSGPCPCRDLLPRLPCVRIPFLLRNAHRLRSKTLALAREGRRKGGPLQKAGPTKARKDHATTANGENVWCLSARPVRNTPKERGVGKLFFLRFSWQSSASRKSKADSQPP